MNPSSWKTPLALSPDCELKLFCSLVADECPIIPLLGPLDAVYDFVRDFVDESVVIGKLVLPSNLDEIDGIIETALWKYYFEFKYWFEKLTNAILLTIIKKAVKHDPKCKRRVIFIVARTANLDFDKLDERIESNTCFFQIRGNIKNSQFKFFSSSSFKTKDDILDYENIVIIASLTTLFGAYDLNADLKKLFDRRPSPSLTAQSEMIQDTRADADIAEPSGYSGASVSLKNQPSSSPVSAPDKSNHPNSLSKKRSGSSYSTLQKKPKPALQEKTASNIQKKKKSIKQTQKN